MSTAAAAQDAYIKWGLQWSSIALVYYDYALTFPSEVKYMWRAGSHKKLSTLLYILCRFSLISNVLYAISISDLVTKSSTAIYQTVLSSVSVVTRAGILTVFLMRTYAVCGQSKLVLLGLGLILVAIVVLDSARLALSDVPQTDTTCAILVCVYDTVSTVLTILASLRPLRAGSRPMKDLYSTFHYLVLEQGVLYFCAISSFTIPAAVFQFGMLQKFLNMFTLPFSGILAARFLLHLRAYSDCKIFISDNDGSLEPYHDSQVSTFRAVGRAIASTIDDFDHDPMSSHWQLTDDEGTSGGS